jgi:glycine C-acetyltransferase/8-amino-7-oxononanoate synthase
MVSALGLKHGVDVVIGTLSKALGSYGAFACCSSELRKLLVNRARTLIFSTGLPPASVAAASAALAVLRRTPELVDQLHTNSRVLRAASVASGFPVPPGDMPIVPLVVGDPEDTMSLCEAALREGVFAQAIRPPTVPEGTSRLRLVATATHTPDDLRQAAAILATARAPGSQRELSGTRDSVARSR